MIERGITMTGDNPALILADLKTHSRRVIDRDPAECKFVGKGPGDPENFIFESRTEPGLRESETCPYGQKGDGLYVRETFAMRSDIDWRKQPAKALHYARYKADGTFDPKSEMNFHDWDRWRSPRFMPKCLARLRLEIVDPIRVEQLQDITQRDAQAIYLDDALKVVSSDTLDINVAMIMNGAELHMGPRKMTRDVHGYYTVSGALRPKPRQTTGFRFRWGANVIYNGSREDIALTVLIVGEEKARAKFSW